jgi:hypothetical protein
MMEDLPTIKVCLSFSGAGYDRYSPQVEFEVGRGSRVLHRFTVDPSAVGIPPGFDPGSYRQGEPEFALAGEVAVQLTHPELFGDPGRPAVWLQLASPIGYLAALPWERMLRPVFPDRPILRIPDFTLVPELGDGPVDVVLCVSEPGTEPQSAASLLLDQLIPPLTFRQLNTTIHVFADQPTYRMHCDQRGTADWLVLHDPQRAGELSDDRPQGRERSVTDPWLVWLLREMQGSTVEAVHFLAHGYLTGDQPAIAMSESPTAHDERLWARFISPGQLSECLTQLGAWSVGFSSPPGNFSPLGLREFADSVARLRPGPVLYHDANRSQVIDPVAYSRESLGWVYWRLFNHTELDLEPGSFIYVHPRMVGIDGEPAYAERLVEQTLRPGTRGRVLQPWATTTRRFLEQSTAQLFPDQDRLTSSEQEAVGEGVRSALAFVSEVIRERGGQQA